MASTSSSSFSSSPRDISGSSPAGYSCAYPSWPTGNSFGSGVYRNNTPSSYISDEDLFGDDLLGGSPFLEEAPAPPRIPQMPQVAQPLLPLYATPKKSRQPSSKKQRRPSKPMSPISESPEKPAE
ncbi:hypothetical protein BFW01_g11990 [Lasiodiplodia theobromae]|nr:uncharacterized protein LTHEOB_3059 [Lasiodiplodia theobromae]KAF4534251.1 hypothetical protein LTHEOB_3059 [Lasiodiplodia theobromae]KAF9640184.1 hypothetical protein BFW01_g11990 [Lasiodiplodia theobromae]KAK0659983.1 hypothetical protein DIS24_g3549 [Lasiodiplodia hormozganensis]